MQALRIENLQKSFGAISVLKGVDMTINNGEVVAVIGRSGSGKSTMLRCINGLESFNSGLIEVAGHRLDGTTKRLRDLRKEVGMVFQSYNLFPHLTVAENIKLAPRVVKNLPVVEQNALVQEVLTKVGLRDKADAYPDSLSGGQQQRAAIARALAMRPSVMLFDEPTSALDPELVGEVLKVMRDLAAEGRTMLIVTHEMAFARDVSTRTVFLHKGRIEEEGPPFEVFSNPRSERFRQFVSREHLQG